MSHLLGLIKPKRYKLISIGMYPCASCAESIVEMTG